MSQTQLVTGLFYYAFLGIKVNASTGNSNQIDKS